MKKKKEDIIEAEDTILEDEDAEFEVEDAQNPDEEDLESAASEFGTESEILAAAESYEYSGNPLIAKALRHSLLTKEQELEYGFRIQKGDVEARNALVEHNYKLAFGYAVKVFGKVAKANPMITIEDLFQTAVTDGLVRAAEKFDPEKGYKFSTYAFWWIRQSVSRYIYDNSYTIRLPVHCGEELGMISKITAKLIQDLGREPDENEIAEASCGRFTASKVLSLLKSKSEATIKSLDFSINPDDGLKSATLHDFTPTSEQADDQTSRHEAIALVDEILNRLEGRERDIVMLRHGLGDDKRSWTLEEIARKYGVTRERIRQLEKKGIERIRKSREMYKRTQEVLHGGQIRSYDEMIEQVRMEEMK